MEIERATLCIYTDKKQSIIVAVIRQDEKDKDCFFVRKRGSSFKAHRKNLTPIFQLGAFARKGVELSLDHFLGEGISDVNIMVMIDRFLPSDDCFSQS